MQRIIQSLNSLVFITPCVSSRLNHFTLNKKQVDPLWPEGFRQHLASLLLSTLAINVLSLALPVMTLQIYDRILPNSGSGTLPVLTTGVCIAVALEVLLRLSRVYIIGQNGAIYEHRMACTAMSKVLNADLSKMQTRGVGEHLHHMSSVSKLKEFYNGHAMTTLAELAFVPFALALIGYIAGWLVMVPVCVLTLFTFISICNGHHLKRTLQGREETDDKRFNFLIETLEGVHTVKALALEKYFERRYEALEEASVQANYAVTQQTANTFNSGAIFSHIMIAGVITIGAWAVLSGDLTTGSLIATLLLAGRVMQPVQKALALWTRYQDYQLARSCATDLMETIQQEVVHREHDSPVLREGRLELKNVSFHYAGQNQPIIEHISLSLQQKQAILISGDHGCGKTTLMKLIAGIYPASEGKIHIDGEPVGTYQSSELAHHVAYVCARPVIFRGTIRDNITGFGQIPEVKAKEIAALMGLEKDISRLPGGFDTFLSGNETDSIPPGLKQRIAIVRALATRPKLILFDNADLALDKDGYNTMHTLLARLKGKASMVIVSDDYNIRSLTDKHYLLKDGQLLEDRTPDVTSYIRPYQELAL